MLGGHLDSWHSATGATDNAIGCAVMMEAARILKALGVQPRRTIRVALWSGEEQGLLGSKAYVKEHFGTYENPKPEFATFAGYFNVDSGTGRIRGASVFGPKDAADDSARGLRAVRGPRRDGRLDHAQPPHRRHRQHVVQRGRPARASASARIRSSTAAYTWHTNLDTYERIVEDDVQKSAIAVAAAVYHLAMRDEMLPRFSKEEMPPAPAAPAGGQ